MKKSYKNDAGRLVEISSNCSRNGQIGVFLENKPIEFHNGMFYIYNFNSGKVEGWVSERLYANMPDKYGLRERLALDFLDKK